MRKQSPNDRLLAGGFDQTLCLNNSSLVVSGSLGSSAFLEELAGVVRLGRVQRGVGEAVRPRAARRAVSTLFFVNGALFATWASRLPAVQAARGLSHGALGLALLAMALGAMLTMPVAGWLSARLGSHRVSQWCALLYCALLPGLVLAPGLPLFAGMLFCFGAAHGALDVAMNAQAVAVEKAYRRPIMSSFHAVWSTGCLAGAVAGSFLASRGLGLLMHFGLMTGLLGTAAVLVFSRLPPVQAAPQEGSETGGAILRWPCKGLLALGAVALCVMVGEGAMADWSAVYLRHNVHTSEGLAAAGYAAFSIAMALGRYGGDWLSARLGAVKLVRFGALLSAAGLFAALACPVAAVALAGFACVGLGFATIVPMVFSAAGHRPGMEPGMAVASVTTLGYVGLLIGPTLIGMAGQLMGLRCGLAFIVGTSLVAAGLARVLRPVP